MTIAEYEIPISYVPCTKLNFFFMVWGM